MSSQEVDIKAFNERVEAANELLFITRDSDLQRNAIKDLEGLSATVGAWKRSAIAKKHEENSNLCLGMQCSIAYLTAELKMWLLLKEEKPEEAWNQLVDAQEAAADAMRAHRGFAHLDEFATRMAFYEKTLFPPQMFFSAGLIVEREICTICGQTYGDCEHLVGLPYMGEFCRRRLLCAEPNHIALVRKPANKRCRVVQFSDRRGTRNKMTWRLEPTKVETEFTATGVIISEGDFIC